MAELIKSLGGPTTVGRLLGISAASVSEWKGRIPVDRRVELERCLYPKVAVESMGDDIAWVRVPDAQWPNPAGRPCVDIAARKLAA